MDSVTSVADQVLPLDGPCADEQVEQAALLVGEMIRRLNHATRSTLCPQAVANVALNLGVGMSGLPQTFNQLGHSLNLHAGVLTLRADAPDLVPTTVVEKARASLAAAGDAASQAAEAVHRAGSWASHLYFDDDM
jgi:hypothetical protein